MAFVTLNGQDVPCLDPLCDFLVKCKKQLTSNSGIKMFKYPEIVDPWPPKRKIEKLNRDFLSQSHNGNIYAISTFCNSSKGWQVKYIGRVDKANFKDRIISHFIDRNESGPKSKLEKVKKSVKKGACVAVSYILIEPHFLSHFVESELIVRLNTMKDKGGWNMRIG